MPEGATGRPLIRLSPSLPPANPPRDMSGASAEGAGRKGLVPRLELGCDKKETKTECTKVFKPFLLAREGREETGEATLLALTLILTGVTEGDTEGEADVGVATEECFLPLETNDFLFLRYSSISSVDQELHSLHLVSTEHKTSQQ